MDGRALGESKNRWLNGITTEGDLWVASVTLGTLNFAEGLAQESLVCHCR